MLLVYKKTISIVLMIGANFSPYFFSKAYADERPSNSVFQTWADSEEWLRLLHVKKTAFGLKSNVHPFLGRPSFFLHPDGDHSPLSELKETYSQMFEQGAEKGKSAQCRFLARRDFFRRMSKLDLRRDFFKCEFSEDWLAKLNTEKLTLVFASGYMNSAASSFGHTFFKLHNLANTHGKDLLDYGVNFSARTGDNKGALYALYGLFGYFPGTYSMLPYHQMIKEYTNLEGRDLWEYDLNLKPDEIQRMLWHLMELDGTYFDYYFLSDNCSFALLKALEVARPGLKLADDSELYLIPLDSVKRITGLVEKVRLRKSLATIWIETRPNLSSVAQNEILKLKESTSELPRLSTELLDSGLLYYTLQESEGHDGHRKLVYEISKERAKRVKNSSEKLQVANVNSAISDFIEMEGRPDQSHNSAAVNIGFQEGIVKSSTLGFHFAFHDQLSRNLGLTPFSHLEVLSGKVRSKDGRNFQLQDYRILETFSSAPVNRFEMPLSWGVKAGGTNFFTDEDRSYNYLGGVFGYSFDFFDSSSGVGKVRWSHLASINTGDDSSSGWALMPGYESRLWTIFSSEIRSLIKYKIEKHSKNDLNRFSIELAVDLTKQLELRMSGQRTQVGSKSEELKTIGVHQNF